MCFQWSRVLAAGPGLWEASRTNLVPLGGDWSPEAGKSASISPPPSTPVMRGGLSTKHQARPVSFDLLETYLTKLALAGSVKFVLQGPLHFEFCGSHTF